MNQLIELRIRAHEGDLNGRGMARIAYEQALCDAVEDDPKISWQDLDIALRGPYREALRKRGLM